MQRVYCYTDESGQDTKSKIFIIGVLAVENKDEAEKWAGQLDSHKKALKWYKTHYKNKIKFLQELAQTDFLFYIYVRIFPKATDGQDYNQLFLAGLKDILKELKGKEINLIIDGKVKRAILLQTGSFLRRGGITVNKVTNADDKKVPLIRIIDAVVGAVRDYWEGENRDVIKEVKALLKMGKIVILK